MRRTVNPVLRVHWFESSPLHQNPAQNAALMPTETMADLLTHLLAQIFLASIVPIEMESALSRFKVKPILGHLHERFFARQHHFPQS